MRGFFEFEPFRTIFARGPEFPFLFSSGLCSIAYFNWDEPLLLERALAGGEAQQPQRPGRRRWNIFGRVFPPFEGLGGGNERLVGPSLNPRGLKGQSPLHISRKEREGVSRTDSFNAQRLVGGGWE